MDSLPSPELVLFTESLTFPLLITNFTPSFLSIDTVVTLSIESINSLDKTFKDLSLLERAT